MEFSTQHLQMSFRLFKALGSEKQPDKCFTEAPFYLAVNYNHTIDGFWHKNQKMGIQKMGMMMKKKKKKTSSCLSGEKLNSYKKKKAWNNRKTCLPF